MSCRRERICDAADFRLARKLGMSEYLERFAENGINVAALPHLTYQDLKDIGVLLGHRRIMLAALGELVPKATTAECSAAVAPLP